MKTSLIIIGLGLGVAAQTVSAEEWHVNCGGPGFTAQDGTVFTADAGFSGGSVGTTQDVVANTEDDFLYQSERWGSQFSYQKALPNGNYQVLLKFSELYWQQVNERRFSVHLEGQQIIENLDLIAEVGHDVALDRWTQNVIVNDGELNLDFSSTIDAAKISAISVLPVDQSSDSAWAVNAGGGAYQNAAGVSYLADSGFSGGNTAITDANISNTLDDPLYQSERWGNFSYQTPLPNGIYRIVLQFAEIYWDHSEQRQFDVLIEGSLASQAFDINAQVGKHRAIDLSYDPVAVTDGTLNLDFVTVTDAAKLSAIRVEKVDLKDDQLSYPSYTPKPNDHQISRTAYLQKLQGFWLGQSIANWTGLITEMDRITQPFYTDEIWGTPDQENIWGFKAPHSDNIDFYLGHFSQPWGADDDTDIEYMYQHMLDFNNTSVLTGDQIRWGWLTHIYSNEDAPNGENFLWVSNERAYYLMKDQQMTPPSTSEPEHNPDFSMIDAQLTTEIFGLFAPGRPDTALRMAHLPIRTTAKFDAEWISKFYVHMYSLGINVDPTQSIKDQLFATAHAAKVQLPTGSFARAMFDFAWTSYVNNPDKSDWEKTRDEIFQRYQLGNADGYQYQREFDAGINFAASLVSLFYGEGDFLETIRIGSLAGWDSDNPTATWGGLLGFIIGKKGIEAAFNRNDLSDTYWITRTRRNFADRTPNLDGEDTFQKMAQRGVYIIDRVVQEEMGGGVDLSANLWFIPE